MAAITCEGLAKSFGGHAVLTDVGCSVEHGEVMAVMGLSGSGKSTFLRTLALLERADAGSAWLAGTQYLKDGRAIVDPPAIRQRISMVFQQFNLFPNLTVIENCTLGPTRSLNKSAAAAERDARTLLGELRLDALAERFPGTLSGGEAQRVALARALLMNPSVLLLDEVTAALDPESVYAVLSTIKAAKDVAENRLAIILVTHLLGFAEGFATNIGFLHQGIIVDRLPARSFAQGAISPAARAFIDREKSGWLPFT